MEHVTAPLETYQELARVLKPGGRLISITANLWDYASLGAKVVPNRLHPWLVARMEGRAEEDVFPTAYKTNTRRAVRRWAHRTGFEIESFDYLGQYPAYFLFNAPLFLVATAYEKLISNVALLQSLRGWILVVLVKTSKSGAPEDRRA
jgi:SAM-dependent methyltransferase